MLTKTIPIYLTKAIPRSQAKLANRSAESKCGGTMTLCDPFADTGDKFWACSSCTNTLEAQDVLNLENE